MKRAFTIFTLFVLFLVQSPSIVAQDCACTNCPVQIYNNHISYAKLNTTVDGPNDLSECPLQQVCFEISHTWIGDLSASLISPNGTQYLVMADINNDTLGCGNQFNNINVCVNLGTDNPLTNNTEYICDGPQWACLGGQDYTVPCGGVTDPRAGGVEAPNCNLNDFNTPGAPANGQWTLAVSDICPWDVGFIETFTLEFECGVACYSCEADGGSLLTADITACEGDEDLSFLATPEWETIEPNSTEYGYTFLISQNDTIIEFSNNPDLTALSGGYYNVCGLSYYLLEENNLPSLIGLTISELLISTPFCADLSSNCAEINIISTQEITLVEMSKCAEDCITFNNTEYCDANTYDISISTEFGCDSLIQLVITDFQESEIVEISVFKCTDDCTNYNGIEYCNSGVFDLIYQNANACDSLVQLTVSDYEETEITQETLLICEGACGNFDGTQYCNTGTFDVIYQTLNGCDSLVQLTVSNFDEVQPTQETLLICDGACGDFDGTQYCNTGTFDIVYQNELGCDSLVQLTVSNFDEVQPTQETLLICDGACGDFDGTQYCNTGTFDIVYQNELGCDSLVQLTVSNFDEVQPTQETLLICDGACGDFDGTQYCNTGTFDIVYQNELGCDSLVQLTVSNYDEVQPRIETLSICEGACGNFDGMEYCSTGMFDINYQNQNGCDSLVRLLVSNFDEIEATQIEMTACLGDCVTYDGIEYCETGVFEINYQSQNSCDSLVQLTVSNFEIEEITQIEITTCLGDCVIYDGVEYCQTGTFDINYQNQNGCDSLIQLTVSNFEIEEATQIEMTACLGDCVIYDGVEYCQTGTFDINYQNQNGCDSLIQLTISNFEIEEATQIEMTACLGDCVIYDGVEYCQTGTFDINYQNQNGCDSLIQLTISNFEIEEATQIEMTACLGDCVIYDGVEYCQTGTFDINYQNQNGCDSLIQLTISNFEIEEATQITLFVCEGECLIYENIEYCNADVYDIVLQNENGCDSLVQLTLANYEEVETTNVNLTICENDCLDYEGTQYCEAGIFDVILTTGNGCDSLINLIIDIRIPSVVIAIPNPITCINQEVTLDGSESEGENFVWTNALDEVIGTEAIITVSQAGCYTLTITETENNQACQNTEEVCVSDNSQPVTLTQITANEAICQGEEITYSTPIDPLASSYEWNIPSNADIVAGENTNEITLIWLDTTGGEICVAAVNDCGIGEFDCTTTIVHSLPQGQLSGDIASCDGEATSLHLSFTGLAPFTATINNEVLENLPAEYDYVVSPENTTTYTLSSISDTNSCATELDEAAIITVYQTPIIDNIPSISVCNTDGQDDIHIVNFDLLINNPVNGEWEDTGSSNATGSFPNLNFFNVNPGTYTFTFTSTDANFPCENTSATVDVIVENCSCPNGDFSGTSLCNDNATIDLTSLQAENQSGTWSIASAPVSQNPATISGSIFNADGADAGDYSIQFTLSETPPPGCPTEWNAVITVFQALSAGTSSNALEFCANENGIVNLFDEIDNEDLGGVWTETSANTSQNNAFNPTSASFNIEGQSEGTYLFTYTQAAELPCASENATVTILINPMPVVDAGEDQMITCDAPTADLGTNATTQGSGVSYVWGILDDIVSTEPFLETTNSGEYTLTVINEFDCTAIDTVMIESMVSTPNADITLTPVSCYDENDGSIIINEVTGGQEPYMYSLDGENFSAQTDFFYLEPAIYTLIIEDANGCQNEIVFNIEQPQETQLEILASLTGENENTITLGDSISLSALTNVNEVDITSIIWSPGQYLDCDTCMTVMATPIETTTFTVTIQNNACEEVTTSLTVVVQKGYEVFVPTAFSPDDDGTNDVLYIFAPDNVVKINAFRIFSRWGTNLFERANFAPNDPEHGWNGSYKGQEMNSGVYVWYAEVEYLDGEIVIYKGDLTLMR